MTEDISSPHWYIVARHKGNPNPKEFWIAEGPLSTHAHAILQLQQCQQHGHDTVEFTIADIRFPTLEGLLQRPAARAQIEAWWDELLQLQEDFRSHCNSPRHPWVGGDDNAKR